MLKSENLQPVLSAAQKQLGLTFSASDSLDTKALGVLGFNLAVLIFSLQSETHNQWWLLVPLFLFFGLSLLCAIMVFWPSDYLGAVVNIKEHEEYLSMPNDKLLLQLLADTQEAIDLNNAQNGAKSTLCTTAIVLSLTGVGLLVGCIM